MFQAQTSSVSLVSLKTGGEGVGMGELIATFDAVIPDVQGALKVSGQGAGVLRLDMDESQLPEVLKLVAFGKDRLLTITVHAH